MKTKALLFKSLLLATAMFLMTPLHAWEPAQFGIVIQLTLMDIQPEPTLPRSPIEVPQIGQTDHALYFLDEIDLSLNLYSVDEIGNETLEYATVVPATTTSVQLPTDLSGTYIIEVICDGLYFRGEIEL